MHVPQLASAIAVLTVTGCGTPPANATAEAPDQPRVAHATVVLAAELDWQPLNPARGDASPMAANLWGDRTTAGATGFVVRFAEGFSSPPHIHNVSYRGVVLEGLVHNDDPPAEPMWMPVGSYWTQPKGAPHITSSHPSMRSAAYIEIDDGPYLVRPVEDTFETDEHPINVHASNLVWADVGLPDGRSSGSPPRTALLWGDPDHGEMRGALLALSGTDLREVRSQSGPLRAVVIEGQVAYHDPTTGATTTMDPGSYIGTEQGAITLSCVSNSRCTLYLRLAGALDIGAPEA